MKFELQQDIQKKKNKSFAIKTQTKETLLIQKSSTLKKYQATRQIIQTRKTNSLLFFKETNLIEIGKRK